MREVVCMLWVAIMNWHVCVDLLERSSESLKDLTSFTGSDTMSCKHTVTTSTPSSAASDRCCQTPSRTLKARPGSP